MSFPGSSLLLCLKEINKLISSSTPLSCSPDLAACLPGCFVCGGGGGAL